VNIKKVRGKKGWRVVKSKELDKHYEKKAVLQLAL
jgi:hypothetical protein